MANQLKTDSAKWLNSIFSDRGVSGIQVADAVGMDRGNFNKSVNGKVNFTFKKLAAIADYLDIGLDEILEKYRPDLKAAADGGAKLVGSVDEVLQVKFSKTEKAIAAFGLSHVKALQVKSPSGALSGIDGALIYYKNEQKDPSEVVGVMSVITLKDGSARVGIINKGYEKGTFNLLDFAGRLVEENLSVTFAQSIALIKI